jgi:cytochrome c5
MSMQQDWRYCQKCHSMFYDGYPNKGNCAAGGGHDAQGFMFFLPHDLAETPTAQGAWRYCQKCHSMFYDGYPNKGNCAAGDGHDAQGFNFVLPHDLPASLDFDFNPIVFGGGVPVGGNSHLTIRQDGSFTFSGHFHDSGATEYNVALVWAVKDSQNMVYTFQHSGHVSGTFESGSRNDDWAVDSRNDNIASRWANIAAGSIGEARADANIDLINLTNSLIGTLGTVLGVVAIVIA